MGSRFMKVAVVYFLIGLGLGIYMSSAQDLRWGSLHAHINLLGWVSTALFGVIYHLFPKAGHHPLAKWHFWLHNVALPFFIVFLFLLLLTHNVSWEAGIIPSASLIIIGAILLVVNVFMNVSASSDAPLRSSQKTTV